ncbi:MAG: nickel-responsive transcriptional regulator NikR [Dysgonamonadaceae bacterium]|jgi:CopG family nickel-responsive transcriptional regulator|nr:nickel-responsive transcriptional regulator NikR [Dysgonamonadaceae bacterium]
MSVSRFGVSLESDLLEALDNYVSANNFPNRSQAIRQLIERNTVEKKWQCNNIVAGAIILVYDNQKRDLINKLEHIQLAYHKEILSVQHFYFSQTICFDTIAVKGPSYLLTELSDKLIALKGMRHGKLIMTRTDEEYVNN